MDDDGPIFNAETIATVEEVEEMIKNPSKQKTYSTVEEALADALSEEE